MGMTKRIELFGIVQGVGMRFFINREARKLGLHGFVKNTATGSVLIEVTGERGALATLIKRIEKYGPGQIDALESENLSSPRHQGGFHVKY